MEENRIYTTDRISVLPDSIVHHILSYLLDDPKSCVRMSILSKEWFALTASFPILYFRQDRKMVHLWSVDEGIMEKFCKYVQYTVSRFCKQNISAHTLDISANIINLEQRELFGRCLDLVLKKGLQVMCIYVYNYYSENVPMFRLPKALLSASSLTSLTLIGCELPSPLMVGGVELKSLRLLSLSDLPIGEGVIEYLTKGCPLLEEMYLQGCYGFKTFCVKRHQNLLKVQIYCGRRFLLEIIDVEAPNLSYFLLVGNKNKAPSMFMASCKKLTTFCYSGSPFERLSDFLSNFPFIENLCLDLPPHVNNLKLSNHSLKKIRLQSHCDLEKLELNTPSLLLFEYYDGCYRYDAYIGPLSRKHSSMSKGCMKCVTHDSLIILWRQKFRQFLEKNNIFKVLKLVIHPSLIDVEELKLIQSPPYELEHVKLKHLYIWEMSLYVALVDAVLWCFRPRFLTLKLNSYIDTSHVAKYTYEKLLKQEDGGQTNIKFVLISFSKDDEQHFSDLNSLLKALSLDQSIWKITFIKEEAVQENGACK